MADKIDDINQAIRQTLGLEPRPEVPNREYTSWGWKQGDLFSHYGVLLEKDKPTTGVISINSVEYIDEEIFGSDAIDLAWQEHCEECKGVCHNCRCNHEDGECHCYCTLRNGVTKDHEYDPCEDDHDGCGPEERGTVLIGSWKKVDGNYEPDPEAKGAEYAAVVREFEIQVVWSKYTTRCAGCSPCFPGQGNLESPPGPHGDFLCYTLPPDLIGGTERKGEDGFDTGD